MALAPQPAAAGPPAAATPVATPAPPVATPVATPPPAPPAKKKIGFSTILVAISVVCGSLYLTAKEVSKMTVNGSASYRAEMHMRETLSNDEVELAKQKTRQAEIELQTVQTEKQRN